MSARVFFVGALCILVASAWPAAAQEKLDYYLPTKAKYDPKIPTPESYFGFQIGQRHLQHHELVGYLQKLAELSPRATIQEYARSHGKRPRPQYPFAERAFLAVCPFQTLAASLRHDLIQVARPPLTGMNAIHQD